jgi:hypothetical protein
MIYVLARDVLNQTRVPYPLRSETVMITGDGIQNKRTHLSNSLSANWKNFLVFSFFFFSFDAVFDALIIT